MIASWISQFGVAAAKWTAAAVAIAVPAAAFNLKCIVEKVSQIFFRPDPRLKSECAFDLSLRTKSHTRVTLHSNVTEVIADLFRSWRKS